LEEETMDFNDSPEEATFRKEVRAWLDANATRKSDDRQSFRARSDDPGLLAQAKAWQDKKAAAGFARITWPKEYGGRGGAPILQVIYQQEESNYLVPLGFFDIGLGMCIPTMMAYATPEQLKRYVKPALHGKEVWCQLFSEPAAGSDVAGIRTRAERDGDGWVINGQKVWTSGAVHAHYGMLLARTDWDVPKHKGLTFFFFPMKQPGVEVRPLRQITDESHFNEVFITNARVPAANIMGGLNNGWRVMQTALAYERSTMGDRPRGARHSTTSNDLVALARQYGGLNDPALRQDLAGVLALRKLNALNNARAKANLEQGTSSPVMSLGKLAMSRILHEEARVRTAIIGAESLLDGPDHPFADDANFLAFNAYFTSIGGGTDQIQRNIISERVLGLPKEIEVDRNMPFRQVRSG
jgi:alkylation response protein AidB-like acyl-CoA dehydrogenase